MKPEIRDIFDKQLERVLPELPQQVREFMENVPLVVEDHPSPAIMRRVGVRHRSALCGLYTGIPLNKRSVNDWGVPSDVIHIFRQGILSLSRAPDGHIDDEELRKQIRFTILHEYGHHVGLSERDLRALGYG
ncbi:MAG TPA: metallopeptidase family protein [Lacipirellulaceae bacterium]|jgi:predicted Zn-dependent protease with MMP-like domain|nr:metallopeptidase family protein [Lacipirellulaceae bacterium]